jgi:hypothetical protein
MNSDHSQRGEGSQRPTKLLEEDLTREIIGAFYEVYNALGYGFLERIYKRALEIALRRPRGWPTPSFRTKGGLQACARTAEA